MTAERHLVCRCARHLRFRISLAAALLMLGVAGCLPDRDQVIDRLPSPTTGYRPHQPPSASYPPAPPSDATAQNPWWKWQHKPAPPKVGASFAEPGWIPPGGIRRPWECIVVHHSSSDKDTPKSMDAWHRQRGWECLGYDFVIGNGIGYPDGQVFVGPRWTRQMVGAHCKTPGAYYNEYGIGICLLGNLDRHRPTERQMQSLARLVSFLQAQCGIGRHRILTHGGVTHKTECPGRYFSMSDLLRRLNSP